MKPKRSSLLRKRQGSVRAKTRYISELIKESTNAPAQDAPMIEHIMRNEFFHSTLDWKSQDQLVDGARAAHSLLVNNRELFEFEQKAAAAFYAEMTATAQTPQASSETKRLRLK
jgi:hypothetical protein